jgi:hypothetical protein
MLAHTGGAVEAPSWRRSDAYNRTGLDYSTCYRVEADIPTGIRSLLLSRHAYCPPRTPWPSDEMASRQQEDYDVAECFGFNSARSVAKSARLESGMVNLSSKLVPDLSYVPEILPVSRQNTERSKLA